MTTKKVVRKRGKIPALRGGGAHSSLRRHCFEYSLNHSRDPVWVINQGCSNPRRYGKSWVEQCSTSHQGHIGDEFYGSNDPTNSVRVLKKDRVHRRIAGGAWGCWLLEKSEIFRLSEILRRRSEIFITYLYKKRTYFLQKCFTLQTTKW